MSKGGLNLPPLLTGALVPDGAVHDAAVAAAREGCDSGLLLHGPDGLPAALVLAPEVPPRAAAMMGPLAGVALAEAFGTLAPPEVALHLAWDGTVYLNGGMAGQIRLKGGLPDWLVLSLALDFAPRAEAGTTPDRTSLAEEGCGDLSPADLAQGWARHMILWIDRWEAQGAAPVLAMWRGLLHGVDAPLAGGMTRFGTGRFAGLDEEGNMMIDEAGQITLVPLERLL